MSNVLVTRPAHLALPLIEQLKAEGFFVQFEPLMTIAPTDASRPKLKNKCVVMLTSRTTLNILETRRDDIRDLFTRPCYCVGEKTAAAALAFGFEDVRVGRGDARALALMILEQQKAATSPVLHLGGADVVPDSQNVLREGGFRVVHWPVYKAVPAHELTEGTLKSLRDGQITAALFFSARTAQTFVDLLARERLEICCATIIAVALSEAVADVLRPVGWARVDVARLPTQRELIASLLNVLPFH